MPKKMEQEPRNQRKMPSNELNDITLFGQNVLIQEVRADEETDEGLIKTAQDEDRAYRGIVLAKGEEAHNEKIAIGKMIYFNRYATTKFFYRGKEYLLLQEEDVIGSDK